MAVSSTTVGILGRWVGGKHGEAVAMEGMEIQGRRIGSGGGYGE
jgi:hypothetical protein